MKGVGSVVFIAVWVSLLLFACSNSGDDLGALNRSLEDRLTDAIEFDSDELRDGAPPAGEAGENAPQLVFAEVPGGMAVETGFVFSMEGEYKDTAAIKKAVVFVYGASRHFLVDVLAYEQDGKIRVDLLGRLGSDDRLIGEKFTFKLALQNDQGVTGQYIDLDVTIAEAITDDTLKKVNLFDDEYHESGRPEGTPSETAPQIDAFTYPAEVSPGGTFNLRLRTSFKTPELIKSAIISTPHSSGYREYFTEAVPLRGKTVSDSLVSVDGSFSEELEIGAELVFIVALRKDNGETGIYRSFKVKVVEKAADGDSETEADGDVSNDGDDEEGDGDTEDGYAAENDFDPEEDNNSEDDIDSEDGDITDNESEPDGEKPPAAVICHVHSGAVGAAMQIQVGLQNIETPPWSAVTIPLVEVGHSSNDYFTTYEYSAEAVPPGEYRASARISASFGGSLFLFPDDYYWAAEGPQRIDGSGQIEFNIWVGVSPASGAVEDVSVEIDSGLYLGADFLPAVYAVLNKSAPETLDWALANAVAIRRVENGVNGYTMTLNSIPGGTYYVSMWIDRCQQWIDCTGFDTADDVFHFDWLPSVVVPQPRPHVNPVLRFDYAELNCPSSPPLLAVPENTNLGFFTMTGGFVVMTVSNISTQHVQLERQASSLPFSSTTEVTLPSSLVPGAAIDFNVSIGPNSAGTYNGTFYLLVDDIEGMYPIYTSQLSVVLQ